MSLNFNKIFTSDAHQCKTSHVTIVKVVQKISKKKEKKVFVAHFHKAFKPRPLMPFTLLPSFAPNERLPQVA